jgi:hypothetical protein
MMLCVTTVRHLCDIYVMKTQKVEKQKNEKTHFFKFLTRVKSNTCKKWSVDSTYTLL